MNRISNSILLIPAVTVLLMFTVISCGSLNSVENIDEGELAEVQADDRMKIIGYVFGSRDPDIESIDAAKLTHINYAFANIIDHKAVLVRPFDESNLKRLNALNEQNPNLKILVSVGGWTWSGGFSDAALTPESRLQFAESVVEMIRKYQLDGIDLDWEYPGQIGAGNVYRPKDKVNFTLLLRAVRKQIDILSDEEGKEGTERYQLTIASGSNRAYFEHTEMDKAQRYLDFINVMAYDFHGEWTPTTGHHTNLFPSVAEPQRNSAVNAVDFHLEAGIPIEKLVLGVAFYGRGWADVNSENNGLFQPYEQSLPGLGFGDLKADYIDKNGFLRHWDDEAKAPYLWNEEERIYYTYDDEESLRYKAEFIKLRGLTGAMYWEHSRDPSQTLLGTLYEELFGMEEP